MTNYTFTGGDERQPEQPKDVDLTHDSPHHTLGRGHTQAAPGNHTHKYTDLVDLPSTPLDHNHDAQYVNVGADIMEGPLYLNTGHLTLNSGTTQGVYWPNRNRFIYVDAAGQLLIANGGGGLAPLQVGPPVDVNSALNATAIAHQVSGPHGPQHTSYIGVPNGNVSLTGLWFPGKSMPGIWKIVANCYGYLQAASNTNIYIGLYLKWGDGTVGTQRNGTPQETGRLHCNAAMGTNRGALTHVAFVDNRVGWNLGAQMQASYDGSPSVAQVGYIRLSAEFFPFGYELGLAAGWVDI